MSNFVKTWSKLAPSRLGNRSLELLELWHRKSRECPHAHEQAICQLVMINRRWSSWAHSNVLNLEYNYPPTDTTCNNTRADSSSEVEWATEPFFIVFLDRRWALEIGDTVLCRPMPRPAVLAVLGALGKFPSKKQQKSYVTGFFYAN